MARSGVKFGRKMEDAIAALLSQRNVDEAARTAGIGRHNRSPLCHALRGQDIHHSVREHKQDNSAGNRERRRKGDGLARAQMIADDCR
jgi:hypothetical protein